MTIYTFELRDGSSGIQDTIGVDLPDRERAYGYAEEVARELMSSREVQTRAWRLDVYENNGERIFAIPFTSVDRTLDHLGPELRSTIARGCEKDLAYKETVSAAQATMRKSRALVARSRGRPYLATDRGHKTIR